MAADIRKAWAHAILLAPQPAAGKGVKIDLPEVMPHVMKPAAITWAMQRGAAIRDAAGHFPTSIETIEKVHAPHSPNHQRSAVDAMNQRAWKGRFPYHNRNDEK